MLAGQAVQKFEHNSANPALGAKHVLTATSASVTRNLPDLFSLARDGEPTGRHFRVRFERFQWLAAPFPILRVFSLLGRRSPAVRSSRIKASQLAPRYSEKQYHTQARPVKKLSILFSSAWPRLGGFAAIGTAGRSPNPVQDDITNGPPIPTQSHMCALKPPRRSPGFSIATP